MTASQPLLAGQRSTTRLPNCWPCACMNHSMLAFTSRPPACRTKIDDSGAWPPKFTKLQLELEGGARLAVRPLKRVVKAACTRCPIHDGLAAPDAWQCSWCTMVCCTAAGAWRQQLQQYSHGGLAADVALLSLIPTGIAGGWPQGLTRQRATALAWRCRARGSQAASPSIRLLFVTVALCTTLVELCCSLL
jgi:hypothetical protein